MRESPLPASSPPVVRGRVLHQGEPGPEGRLSRSRHDGRGCSLADEAEALVQKAVDLALQGDVAMLKCIASSTRKETDYCMTNKRAYPQAVAPRDEVA